MTVIHTDTAIDYVFADSNFPKFAMRLGQSGNSPARDQRNGYEQSGNRFERGQTKCILAQDTSKGDAPERQPRLGAFGQKSKRERHIKNQPPKPSRWTGGTRQFPPAPYRKRKK